MLVIEGDLDFKTGIIRMVLSIFKGIFIIHLLLFPYIIH